MMRRRELTKAEMDKLIALNPTQPRVMGWLRVRTVARRWAKNTIYQIELALRAIRVVLWRKPRRMYFSWRVRNGIRAIAGLDMIMVGAGWDRTKRRQFWRAFVKSAKVREETLSQMAEEMRDK